MPRARGLVVVNATSNRVNAVAEAIRPPICKTVGCVGAALAGSTPLVRGTDKPKSCQGIGRRLYAADLRTALPVLHFLDRKSVSGGHALLRAVSMQLRIVILEGGSLPAIYLLFLGIRFRTGGEAARWSPFCRTKWHTVFHLSPRFRSVLVRTSRRSSLRIGCVYV